MELFTVQSHPALSYGKQTLHYESNQTFLIELSNQKWQKKNTYLFLISDTEKQRTDVDDFCCWIWFKGTSLRSSHSMFCTVKYFLRQLKERIMNREKRKSEKHREAI